MSKEKDMRGHVKEMTEKERVGERGEQGGCVRKTNGDEDRK